MSFRSLVFAFLLFLPSSSAGGVGVKEFSVSWKQLPSTAGIVANTAKIADAVKTILMGGPSKLTPSDLLVLESVGWDHADAVRLEEEIVTKGLAILRFEKPANRVAQDVIDILTGSKGRRLTSSLNLYETAHDEYISQIQQLMQQDDSGYYDDINMDN